MVQEIVQSQENLETTMMTVEVTKDNEETTITIKVGRKTTMTTKAAMAGVKPLIIRQTKVTNGVLKETNLKLKEAGEIRNSHNLLLKLLVDGVTTRKKLKAEAEEETIGVKKIILRIPMTKMEVAAGAEHPIVYKIEIKSTVSFKIKFVKYISSLKYSLFFI
jgi:hypothetical protein